MGRYTQVLGEYNAESTTYSAFAGPSGSSPYQPPEDAQLKGIRVLLGRAAATSLINALVFRLTCTIWKPNVIEIGAVGSGLQTAPALSGGVNSYIDYELDQPVKAGTKITLEGKNVSETDTPVTVSAILIGVFES